MSKEAGCSVEVSRGSVIPGGSKSSFVITVTRTIEWHVPSEESAPRYLEGLKKECQTFPSGVGNLLDRMIRQGVQEGKFEIAVAGAEKQDLVLERRVADGLFAHAGKGSMIPLKPDKGMALILLDKNSEAVAAVSLATPEDSTRRGIEVVVELPVGKSTHRVYRPSCSQIAMHVVGV